MITVQRNCGRLCIDLGRSCPNFADREFLNPEVFTSEQAFYRGELPQCLPQEDGQLSDYVIMEEVSMSLRSTVETEQDLQQVLSRIPHAENFKFIIIA